MSTTDLADTTSKSQSTMKKKCSKESHPHLRINTPGKISSFGMRATRFNAAIPLIDRHVIVSLLSKQLEITLLNIGPFSTLSTPRVIMANAKEIVTNTFIFIYYLLVFRFYFFVHQNKRQLSLHADNLARNTSSKCTTMFYELIV